MDNKHNNVFIKRIFGLQLLYANPERIYPKLCKGDTPNLIIYAYRVYVVYYYFIFVYRTTCLVSKTAIRLENILHKYISFFRDIIMLKVGMGNNILVII